MTASGNFKTKELRIEIESNFLALLLEDRVQRKRSARSSVPRKRSLKGREKGYSRREQEGSE